MNYKPFLLLSLFAFVLATSSNSTSTVEETIQCKYTSEHVVNCRGTEFKDGHEEVKIPEKVPTVPNVLICCALVLFAGTLSGLIIGILSLDELTVLVTKETGTDSERRKANRILPLIQRHHWVLVALILCNAVAIEALPLFLERMVSEVVSIIISVTAVLLIGEILPNAFCMKFGLSIGANTAWLVWIIMIITAPVSWPISKILDALFGKESMKKFKRAELKEIVMLHSQEREGPLLSQECTIISSALDMRKKTVKESMTNISKVFSVRINKKLNQKTVTLILATGHSRIPVWEGEKNNIVGMIHTKQLVGINFQLGPRVHDCGILKIPSVPENQGLYEMFQEFQTNKAHMSLVRSNWDHKVIGIITMDDLVRELIRIEIKDEIDRLTPDERVRRVFTSILQAPKKKNDGKGEYQLLLPK